MFPDLLNFLKISRHVAWCTRDFTHIKYEQYGLSNLDLWTLIALWSRSGAQMIRVAFSNTNRKGIKGMKGNRYMGTQDAFAVPSEYDPWQASTVGCSAITFFASPPNTRTWFKPKARSLRLGRIVARRKSYRLRFSASRLRMGARASLKAHWRSQTMS